MDASDARVSYSVNWGGKQYTGARALAYDAYHLYDSAGKLFFYADSVISLYEGLNSYQNNDESGEISAGLDISMGAIGVYGGPVGFGIWSTYAVINKTIGWENIGVALVIGGELLADDQKILGINVLAGPKP